MNDPLSKQPEPIDDELVAYLDGELDASQHKWIEDLLVKDAAIRRRTQQMERAWSLLDDLDKAPEQEQFATSTLEMVAMAAGQDAEKQRAEAPRQRRRRRLFRTAAVLAALTVGFLTVAILRPSPDRQLLQDLPVLENLDLYRPIGDIAFMYLLRDEKLFVSDRSQSVPGESEGLPGGDEAVAAALPPAESLAERRQRLERMTPGEKQQLAHFRERFLSLDSDQQQRLRELDQSLRADPDASQLYRLIERYHAWLKSLPSFTRTELTGMEPVDRIQAVKKQLKSEARQGDRRLGERDGEVLVRWIRACALRDEKQLLETLPPPQRRRLADSGPQLRQRLLVAQLLHQWQAAGPGKPPPWLTGNGLENLVRQLSPKARTRLESKSTAEQWQQVAVWLAHAMRQRPLHGSYSRSDDERLADFFEKELSDQERDRLLAMPGEEMQRALQRIYLTRTKLPDGREHRGKRPPGDRPPGENRGREKTAPRQPPRL